jgi:hypothetical protein
MAPNFPANVTLSQLLALSPGTTPTGVEPIESVQNGTPVAFTVSQLTGSTTTIINVKASPYNAAGNFNRPSFGGGTGGTDDSAAFQAAIAAATNPLVGTGGIVFVPNGNYLLKSGITLPANVRLVGEAQNSVNLFDGGYNLAPVVTMAGAKCSIENLTIFGCGMSAAFYGGTNDPYPSHPAVLIANNNQDACVLSHCTVVFGSPTLQCLSQDTVLDNCFLTEGYGVGIVQISSAGQIWAQRTSFDQGWPVGAPAGGTAAPIGWAAATAHSVGDVVIGSSGQYLQAVAVTGDAKTGSVIPPRLLYGTQSVDNHVTWQLAVSTNAILIDTSTSSENYLNQCDLSGAYFDAISVTGAGGIILGITNSVISQQINACVKLTTGTQIFINNNELFSGWGNGLGGVYAPLGFSGALTVTGNYISLNGGTSRGVTLSSTSATAQNISNNYITGTGSGIVVDANVGNFIIMGNTCNATSQNILVSSGTSNHYNIIGNIVIGTAISDGGGGGNKTVTGNN